MLHNLLNFYLDDSGTRHPTHNVGKKAEHGYDWFALGGVIFREEDKEIIRGQHKDFCARWNVDFPLHSSEIRALSEENSKYLTNHSTGLRRSGKVRNINGVEMSIWHADQVINFPLTVPDDRFFLISAANNGPNLFHQARTVS